MNARDYHNRFAPFATKQNFFAFFNPLMRVASPHSVVPRRLASALSKHHIEYMDLGGWMPVEGYLTLHLSPVEPYGLPRFPKTTMRQFLDEKTKLPALQSRRLEAPAITLNFNIADGLPLADASLRGINLSHFLEHFDIDVGRSILCECGRVLRPQGVLRVSCPDLRKYAEAYLSNASKFFDQVGSPAFCNYVSLPADGAIFAGKAYDGSNAHKWFYDANTVTALVKECGFSQAAESRLHPSSLPRIADVEPDYRAVETFYVESIR